MKHLTTASADTEKNVVKMTFPFQYVYVVFSYISKLFVLTLEQDGGEISDEIAENPVLSGDSFGRIPLRCHHDTKSNRRSSSIGTDGGLILNIWWDRDKLGDNLQKTFSNLFAWKKVIIFWFTFSKICS